MSRGTTARRGGSSVETCNSVRLAGNKGSMGAVVAGERDEEWFRGFFAENHRQILGYALRRVPEVADDVVAEVFAVAWRRRADVPDPALAWLYGTARRVVLHQQRAHARQQRLIDRLTYVPDDRWSRGDEADRVVDEVAAHREVHRMLARLPGADAELLRLWAWERLDGPDLATVLECSPAAARVRLHRARRRARALLDLDSLDDLLPVLSQPRRQL